MALKNNTWTLNQWYDQDVAGNVSYSGAPGLFAVGYNGSGILGQNQAHANLPAVSSPVQIPGTTWSELVMTNGNVYATRTDGTLWAWGSNYLGGLGQNSQGDSRSSPAQIPGTTWSSLGDVCVMQAAGAIKTDGTLWIWGENQTGALGQNDVNKLSSPVQIPGTTWSSFTINQHQGLAIKTTGELWSWGNNYNGQLAQNSRTQYSSPVQVPGTTWSKIIAADGAILAIKTDGTLWGWGYNDKAILAQNNRTQRSSPVQVGSESTWSDVTLKYRHVAAIKTDGTLWSWGYGSYGQIGNNTNYDVAGYSSPVQIPGTTWSNVAAGAYTTYAKKTDGTFWGWGRGDEGNLGLNTTANYSSPVQIPGATWKTFPSIGNGNYLIGVTNI